MVDEMVMGVARRGLGRGLAAILPARSERAGARGRDELTGLCTHDELVQRVEHARAEARDEGSALAVVVLGLDGFRHVNRAQGHEEGDRLLREVARRLSARRRPEDVVARLGGDEFAVMCPRATPASAERLVERLRQAVERPTTGTEPAASLSATAGVVVTAPGGGEGTGRALVRQAEMAMQRAKDDAMGWAHFDPRRR